MNECTSTLRFGGKVKQDTNISVLRSIELLDEAVGTPSLQRSRGLALGTPSPSLASISRTPLSAARYLSHTPRQTRLGSKIGSFQRDASSSFLAQTSFSPGSILPMPSVLQLPLEVNEDVTTTNIALLLEEDPGISASAGLYHDFMQCLKQNNNSNKVLDLLLSYINICSDQVLMLKKLLSRAAKQQFQKTYSTLDLLDQEKVTWQLIHSLYRDRLEAELASEIKQEMDTDEDGDMHAKSHLPDEQSIVNHLFENDSVIRQSQLVVDWLENCALEGYEMFSEKVKYFSDQAVAWENTLHMLQTKTQGMGAGDRVCLDELDPDAAIRQNRILDDLDKEDETRLLQHIFVCIRAGQLDKAQEVCQQCGQSWRAASLEGWRLYHDSNYRCLGDAGQIKPVEGNPFRQLWKLVCWRMARESQFGQYERAICGVLSGNLRAVLPVCQSWSDYVWAYFRCMVDARVEQEIRLMDATDRVVPDLPSEYWDALLEPCNIFHEIEASTDERIHNEAHGWFRLVQKYIILGDVDALIEIMHSWIRNNRQALPQHLIRFMAHVVLFLRLIEHSSKTELCMTILEAFIDDLIKNKHSHLVAHYVAKLSRDAQVIWYAKFLQDVQDREERQLYLQLAEEEGLDVALITKTVVENIRNRQSIHSLTENGLATETITEEDRQKIEAIDWLVFDPMQRAEAMKQANAVMRAFIALKKHLAAREVFDKLPPDSVDVILRVERTQNDSLSPPAAEENSIREYMCIKAYLDAVESFNDWFALYHKGRPSKPSLPSGASFTDRVAYEHKTRHYDMEMERWKHQLLMQTRTTKDRIYNVLLFADGGWMQDRREELEPDEGRLHQMAQLRKLHLPTLCMNLHYMLHRSYCYAECLQLADVIADEQHTLYKEFSKDDLQRFLKHIRESSLCLLDQNKDPLGYSLV